MGITWESELVPDAKIVVPEAPGPEETRGLFINGAPTRAAVLLYGEDPQRYFPYATIKLGTTELVGTLFDQLEGALAIIPQIFKIERTILQELIANALIHRDYAVQVPIEVLCTDHTLTIMNPGGLEIITLDDLLNPIHPSVTRNPIIAYHFYVKRKIYLLGVGLTRVYSYLVESGYYTPEIVADEEFFKITIRRKGNAKGKRKPKSNSR